MCYGRIFENTAESQACCFLLDLVLLSDANRLLAIDILSVRQKSNKHKM